jgi:hypothetical protein
VRWVGSCADIDADGGSSRCDPDGYLVGVAAGSTLEPKRESEGSIVARGEGSKG